MDTKRQRFTGQIAWGDHRLDFSGRTLVMGILNVTPDSFSDGGTFFDADIAVARGIQIAEEGADIIDVGGQSTRPGSDRVSRDDEIERVLPVISRVAEKVSVPISIDTYDATVARAALNAGASIINDISALRFDDDMAAVAADYDVPVVLMHMQGTPATMQRDPRYTDVIAEIKTFLAQRIAFAVERGIDRGKLIADVGIGFGKRTEHNVKLLGGIEAFYELAVPILAGHSRKGFLGKLLNLDVTNRDQATLALSAYLAGRAVHILRVHSVAATRSAVELIDRIASARE